MASGFGSSSDEDMISGINVTPLVDVVLVLLIIFLITAPMIYQSTIKVQLPKAKTGEQAAKTGLMFTLDKLGALTWNQQKIEWTDLPARLKAQIHNLTEETAVISADEATPHGVVIRLMDSLREAGLTHFALNVDGPAKSN